MKRDVPPYRADHVGSILRSAPLKEARSKRAAGQLSAAELAAVEDAEIRKIITKQEEIGLRSVTDGEFRRALLAALRFSLRARRRGDGRGLACIHLSPGIVQAEAPLQKGKLGSRHHPQIAHFEFLKANTKRTPKMTIPSPSMLHYRGGRNMIAKSAYPAMEEFYRDLGQAYKQAIQGPHAAPAGSAISATRRLQLCLFVRSRLLRPMLADRGEDPDKQGENDGWA